MYEKMRNTLERILNEINPRTDGGFGIMFLDGVPNSITYFGEINEAIPRSLSITADEYESIKVLFPMKTGRNAPFPGATVYHTQFALANELKALYRRLAVDAILTDLESYTE